MGCIARAPEWMIGRYIVDGLLESEAAVHLYRAVGNIRADEANACVQTGESRTLVCHNQCSMMMVMVMMIFETTRSSR